VLALVGPLTIIAAACGGGASSAAPATTTPSTGGSSSAPSVAPSTAAELEGDITFLTKWPEPDRKPYFDKIVAD
jgi:ABC-type glycerol-3-phosphate transport system substrate-binding protein